MNKNQQKTLSELADIRVSNVDKKTTAGEASVFLCNYMDVYSSDYIRASHAFMEATASAAEISRFKVDKGDVLLTKDSETPDDIGIPAVVVDDVEKLVCGYHLALIKPQKNLIDSTYLCKWLGSNWIANYFAQRATGSTRYGLSISALSNVKVHLPPLEVQQKISSILVKIDAAIEKTEALIEKYQQIKAGLMHDLFTRGVQPDGKLRPTREQAPELYRETGIGWIPKEWGIQKVEDCGEVKLGRQRSPDQHSGKWTTPYLRVANVLDGVIDYGDVLEMDFTPTERKLFELYPGDILLNEGQSLELVGRSAIYRGEPGQFCFQNTLVRFRCTPDNHASFFAHLFKLWLDRGAFQIISKQTTSVAHLGADRFAKMVCPKIGLHEQKIIAQRLNSVDERIAKTEAHRKNLAYQKAGLMHDLLTGKVAVKVDEAQEEHA